MKRERKRKGIERLIVWIAAAVMTAGLVVMNFLISESRMRPRVYRKAFCYN